MSAARCTRGWEAEAIEDGRLAGASRDSFDRHLHGCADCAREVAALAKLRALSASLSSKERTDLEHRRQRIALLAGANRSLLGAGGAGRSTKLWLASAAAAVVVGVAGWRAFHERATVASPAAPTYEIDAAPPGAVRVQASGALTILALTDGRTTVHVQHLGPGQRFLASLPDGELEVRGTRFTVDIAGGKTVHVEVAEGSVALRLTGEAERRLRAGESWSRQQAPVAVIASSGALPLAAPMSNAIEDPRAIPFAPAAAAGTRAQTSVGATPSASTTQTGARTPSAYVQALDAFAAGRYEQADALFASFIATAPSDARCEDAVFLRAVCHARGGDTAGAARLAKEYLAAYPSGLRRVDAERLRSGR